MDVLAFPFRFALQTAIFVGLAVWAAKAGSGPEKACSFSFATTAIADRVYHLIVSPGFELETVDAWHFGLDIALFAILIPTALRANRVYPMVLAACQLIALNSHLARDSFEQITPIAYAIMYIAPSYLQLVVLACGIWAHTRRVARYGPYRDWRLSPSPA